MWPFWTKWGRSVWALVNDVTFLDQKLWELYLSKDIQFELSARGAKWVIKRKKKYSLPNGHIYVCRPKGSVGFSLVWQMINQHFSWLKYLYFCIFFSLFLWSVTLLQPGHNGHTFFIFRDNLSLSTSYPASQSSFTSFFSFSAKVLGKSACGNLWRITILK